MTRARRINFDHAWHHVMNRGAGHKNIFLSNADREKFLSLLGEITEQYNIEIHAYCLMSNHYHLLMNTPQSKLSESIRHLNSTYARYFNDTYQNDGPLFRGRFKSTIISFNEYLICVSKYIHINPVKANLVHKAEFYEWSSYNAYLNNCESPKWLFKNKLLTFFSNTDSAIQYKNFIETDDETNFDHFFQDNYWSTILGDRSFENAVTKIIENNKLNNVTNQKALNVSSIDKIKQTVAEYFDINLFQINESTISKENLPRSIAIWLACKFSKYPHKEVATAFSLSSSSSIAVILWRLKQKFSKDIIIADHICQIEQLLLQQ